MPHVPFLDALEGLQNLMTMLFFQILCAFLQIMQARSAMTWKVLWGNAEVLAIGAEFEVTLLGGSGGAGAAIEA